MLKSLRIKSIKKVGKRKTYDIQVPFIHNFFLGNNILSHNSGKTWKMTAMAQIYHSRFKYKIFDIGPGKRNENAFWCFPSDEKKLWAEFEYKAGTMKNKGPKEYKVNLLYPCFSSKIPKKLPEHLPRISTQIFTIYFKEITTEDISIVIGEVSRNSIYLWNRIVKDLPDNACGPDIEDYINRKHKKLKSLSIYRLFIKPAIDNHLLAGKNCSVNLNLISEAKNKETISVLCHDYIPNNTWSMFMMGFIKRRLLFELAMKEKIPKDNIALLREAGDYMKKVDKDLESGEQKQVYRNSLTKVVRYGRSGLLLFMDTQSPADTKNLIEGQEDLLCINEISLLEIKDLIDKLKIEKRIPKYIRDRLHDLEQREMIVVERKEKAILIPYFQPPRSMAYKGKSFERVWTEKINDWKFSINDLKVIYEEYSRSMEGFKEKEEEKPGEFSVKPPQVEPELMIKRKIRI